jgi:capsular polysaccharide biosynthesis protein
MSQQALDLKRSCRIVRGHLRLFGAFVVLGLAMGIAYPLVIPPTLQGTALVVLPQVAAQAAAAEAATGAPPDLIDTQVVIAGSDPVLSAALPHVSPAMSLPTLQGKVKVVSLTESIVSITASGSTPAQAETTANAVASSYIAYVSGRNSPIGYVEAKVLESAVTATGTTLTKRITIDGILGVLGGVLMGFVVALAVGRNDRRLKELDRMRHPLPTRV